MNPLTDAHERAGDAPPATQMEAWRIDVAPRFEIPVDAPPGPARAMRADAHSVPPDDAAHGFGDARGPEESGEWRFEPIRATQDGTDSGSTPQAAHGFVGPRGAEEAGDWGLDPIRATRDGTGAGPVSEAEHDFGDPLGPEELGERRLATIRATRDGTDVDAVAPDADELDGPTALATPPGSNRRSFDPRTLPPRRGPIRTAGTLLSLLAVVGAGAAGGYVFWKTHFVRPALVRHLPSIPVAVVDLTPATDANAATGASAEAFAGTPGPPEAGAETPAAGGAVEPSPGFADARRPVPAAGGAGTPAAGGAVEPSPGFADARRPVPAAGGAGTPAAGGAVEPSPGFAGARRPVPAAGGAGAAPVHGVGSAPNSAEKDEARTVAGARLRMVGRGRGTPPRPDSS